MKIRIAIVDSRIDSECKRSLSLFGFRVIELPPSQRLSEAVASHTDMLIFRLGDELISTADYAEEAPYVFSDLWEYLRRDFRFYYTADVIEPEYPKDCRLNLLRLGDRLFCKADTVSDYVRERAAALGMKIISVKQGYPACTVLKLTEDSVITADRGMARVLEDHGIRVTLIDGGDIELPPHPYGFIGGCAGVCDGSIYFLGDPRTHSSYEKIKAACDDAGLGIVALSGGRLRDLGGILFVQGNIE